MLRCRLYWHPVDSKNLIKIYPSRYPHTPGAASLPVPTTHWHVIYFYKKRPFTDTNAPLNHSVINWCVLRYVHSRTPWHILTQRRRRRRRRKAPAVQMTEFIIKIFYFFICSICASDGKLIWIRPQPAHRNPAFATRKQTIELEGRMKEFTAASPQVRCKLTDRMIGSHTYVYVRENFFRTWLPHMV